MILQQLNRRGAYAMQEIDPAVNGGQVHIESTRQSLFANALIDCAPQHVMFLNSRKPINPMVIGVDLKVFGNQTGRVILPHFF